MKEAIEFIKHAVTVKQYDEQLTQIHACGNHIQSFNGKVLMSHPIEDIGTFSVASTKLLSAIRACNYKPHIRCTTKNVVVTHNSFRALLPFTDGYVPVPAQKGKGIKLDEDTLADIKLLFPFVSDDASRGWSQSMLVRDGWMYVTNNIIVARVKTKLKDCVLPVQLLSVMLKVKRIPTSAIVEKTCIWVNYEEGVWIKGLVQDDAWPDVGAIFKTLKFKKVKEFTKEFMDAIETISDFCEDDLVYITDRVMSTAISDISDIDVPNCIFSCMNMKKILTVFTHADFSVYPAAMPIKAKGIQGAFVGRAG